MITTKIIYLVIEQVAGIIHKAFENHLEAEDYIEFLKKETELDCFEIQTIPYQF